MAAKNTNDLTYSLMVIFFTLVADVTVSTVAGFVIALVIYSSFVLLIVKNSKVLIEQIICPVKKRIGELKISFKRLPEKIFLKMFPGKSGRNFYRYSIMKISYSLFSSALSHRIFLLRIVQ